MNPTVTESGDDEDDVTEGSKNKRVKQEIKVEFELEGKSACIIVREDETIVKCEESARPLLREPILKCFLSL